MNRRLFIAIPFPAPVVAELHALQQGIRGARWLPLQHIHLTLRFLGDVDETLMAPLQERLGRVRLPPFQLTVTSTGCFPPRGLPRVLWAGLAPSPPLQALARQVEEQVIAAGLPAETRPFSPHITLARLSSPDPGEVRRHLEQHRSFTLPPFPVEQFILYASQLTTHGAIHTPLTTVPLTTEQERCSD